LRWNAALVLTGMVPLAHAQTEPAKPIRFLVRSAESRRRRSVASGPQHQGADRGSKKRPGEINCGLSGTGTTVHLSAELFQHLTGVKGLHIPCNGGGPADRQHARGAHRADEARPRQVRERGERCAHHT
jgi:hypothetical protein